jgi:DNA adenine methylase
MDLTKLSKHELLVKCEELGITKCNSKNKNDLIDLINNKGSETNKTTATAAEQNNKSNNISPLRYPGGKTRACKIIDDIITEHFDITQFDTLLSPFFGGGSFEFYFQNKYHHKLIVNDKFTPLYNFWKQIKTNKNALCDELTQITSVSKELFTDYRKTIMGLNDNMLQQSLQYFIINRCSFSGATLSGGFSEEASLKRYTTSSINKIRALDFTNIDVYNLDFEHFVNHFSNDKTLLFLDPPYYLEKQSKLYGNNGDMHEHFNHQLLFDLMKTKQNWLITYNNCEYIKNLYKDYIIIDVNWSYGMNKSKSSSEIIILSK